jgi:hypothetical protein
VALVLACLKVRCSASDKQPLKGLQESSVVAAREGGQGGGGGRRVDSGAAACAGVDWQERIGEGNNGGGDGVELEVELPGGMQEAWVGDLSVLVIRV